MKLKGVQESPEGNSYRPNTVPTALSKERNSPFDPRYPFPKQCHTHRLHSALLSPAQRRQTASLCSISQKKREIHKSAPGSIFLCGWWHGSEVECFWVCKILGSVPHHLEKVIGVKLRGYHRAQSSPGFYVTALSTATHIHMSMYTCVYKLTNLCMTHVTYMEIQV